MIQFYLKKKNHKKLFIITYFTIFFNAQMSLIFLIFDRIIIFL